MHLVATNLGVWIKILVHESVKEFNFRQWDPDEPVEITSENDTPSTGTLAQ